MVDRKMKKSEPDPEKLVDHKKNRVKLDPSKLAQLWIKAQEEIREELPHESSEDREEIFVKRVAKRSRPPSPEILAKWWQEAENQIKLAHPHESSKTRRELTERYVHSRLKKYLENQYIEPHPEERKISEWYREELLKLWEENPHKPLKERERIAVAVVEEKIKQYRKTIRLDEFFD